MKSEQFNLRSPKLLFQKYIKNFSGIGIDWDEEWKQWTRKNLGYFAKLGEDLGYEVYWKGTKKPNNGEYLVDLCWIVEKEQYYWMELGLEEEWSSTFEDILSDFYKLMDVKAYLKVFICFQQDEAIVTDVSNRLAQKVSSHRIKFPEESYLLIIFSRNKRRKPVERLQIEGFGIDYRGNLDELGSNYFPDS